MTAVDGLDRHVVIATASGTFTPSGSRVTAGAIPSTEKIGAFIEWAAKPGRQLLEAFPATADGPAAPARLWVVGDACWLLAGPGDNDGVAAEDLPGIVGKGLAELVAAGWELRGGGTGRFILARGENRSRVEVEIVLDPHPWLAAGSSTVRDDAGELGRRLGRWVEVFGMLPESSTATTGAAVLDDIMGARTQRDTGAAVVSEPGLIPRNVQPDTRIQPAWTAPRELIEAQFDHVEHLAWVQQECPHLASAGMISLGHGTPVVLEGAAAAAQARADKRPFGLWLVTIGDPAALGLPAMLPPPHPSITGASDPVQVWLSTEDLGGLAKPVRDGGAGLNIEQLDVAAAVVWPKQNRFLDAWAKRLRKAREAFAGDPVMVGLVEAVAADYITALADPQVWEPEHLRHHYQPAWLVAIAAHIRLRGRRFATRISREYRVWPAHVHGPAMMYVLPADPSASDDETTGVAIDLTETHTTNLGRTVTTAQVTVTEKMILPVLLAETSDELLDALLSPLSLERETDPEPPPAADPSTPTPPQDTALTAPAADQNPNPTEGTPGEAPAPEPGKTARTPRPRANKGKSGGKKTVVGGIAAAILDTDGLWLPDGTRIPVDVPINHVGDVAELAYTHDLGYKFTENYGEPGQIWLTERFCRTAGFNIDALVEVNPSDRDTLLRESTAELDFVTDAVAQGWRLGGGGRGAEQQAPRLGIWTRVYKPNVKEERKGVWVVLTPGMGVADDPESALKPFPILVGNPAPAQLARRLQLLADALQYPLKMNPGVTALDLMVEARPKGTGKDDWIQGPLAPSNYEAPYTINDAESDYDWSRTPTADEAECLYVHAYDRGGSYPAAIPGTELPIGEPEDYPDGSVLGDADSLKLWAKKPGMFEVEVPGQQEWLLPHVLNPRGLKFTSAKWVSSARLEVALELGYEPTVVQAKIWPEHGRVLELWYQRIRHATLVLDTDDPDCKAARGQVKMIRNLGIGMMGSPKIKGRAGYDPMKRLMIVGKASANIMRLFVKIGTTTGRWPVAAKTDMVLYISNNPDPVAAWPGEPTKWGRGFGQYKHEGSALLADHLQYLNGGAYKGAADLIEPDEWAMLLPTLSAGAEPEGEH